MPNDLTGDFDVIAQLGVPAVNRILAAMHSVERFAHSIALRVDDIKAPPDRGFDPSVLGVVDAFGEPLANHQRIGRPRIPAEMLGTSDSTASRLDAIVNLHDLVLDGLHLEPSNLKGRAQLQLSPPVIEILDNSGSNVSVRIDLMARYFPDPGSPSVAEFLKGHLRITAPVNQVASQTGSLIKVDIRGVSLTVSFTPTWASSTIDPSDLAAINLLIKNAIRTGFLPATNAMPQGVSHIQFKAMQGVRQAVALLLDMNGGPGNRASANNLFLGAGDDFAFAAGSEFVKSQFQPTLDKILSNPVPDSSFTLHGVVHTWHITYKFKLFTANLELKPGAIVIVITGHASTSSWTPNFDFTVKLSFSLSPSGDSADLVADDVSIDTSSWIINRFRGKAENAIKSARDRALNEGNARQSVRDMLSADKNLGKLIESLVQPARTGGQPPLPKMTHLSYSSIEIGPSGVTLHGRIALNAWPEPHVRLEQIPMNAGGRPDIDATSVNEGADYSALKTWIPGGEIQSYEWKSFGSTQPGFIDENRFVMIHQGPEISTAASAPARGLVVGYRPMCVTVRGLRISASGPALPEAVSGTMCAWNFFPVLDSVLEGVLAPMMALTRPGEHGGVEVVGHTSARAATASRKPPNMLVHFTSREGSSDIDALVQAVKESGRGDASTGVLVVAREEDLKRVKFNEHVVYSDDHEGWKRRLDIGSQGPVTVLVDPSGKVKWKHEGEIDAGKLTSMLRESLTSSSRVSSIMTPPVLRIGSPPPNFLFHFDKENESTLRKLSGRPVRLSFAKYGLTVETGKAKVPVDDREGVIAKAYGVDTWPTTFDIDERGLVSAIHVGGMHDHGSESVQNTKQESGR